MRIVRKLWLNDDGQDIAEYSLLLAMVLLVTVVSMTALSNRAAQTLSSVGSAITPGAK